MELLLLAGTSTTGCLFCATCSRICATPTPWLCMCRMALPRYPPSWFTMLCCAFARCSDASCARPRSCSSAGSADEA